MLAVNNQWTEAEDERLIQESNSMDASKWRNVQCTWGRDCLCSLVSEKSGFRFLPNYPEPVYASLPETIPADVARMMSVRAEEGLFSSCGSSPSAGRIMQMFLPGAGSDISLCNIMGSGFDYVYVPSAEMLYVLVEGQDSLALLFLSILVVYLMVVLGHNIQVMLLGAAQDEATATGFIAEGNKKGQWTVLCMILITVTSCFWVGSSGNAANAYVTWEDKLAFYFLVAYVGYYCLRIEANVWFGNGRRANPVNPMLACIWLAVQRVYGSAENPYSSILFFLMLTWLLRKVFYHVLHQ